MRRLREEPVWGKESKKGNERVLFLDIINLNLNVIVWSSREKLGFKTDIECIK